jgi:hypothetical protein
METNRIRKRPDGKSTEAPKDAGNRIDKEPERRSDEPTNRKKHSGTRGETEPPQTERRRRLIAQ